MNLFESAEASIRSRLIPRLHPTPDGAKTAAGFNKILRQGQKAIKFNLPDYGLLLDDGLKGLTGTPFKLPYPIILLEYEAPASATGPDPRDGRSVFASRKRVTVAWEEGESVYIASIHSAEDNLEMIKAGAGKWMVSPGLLKVTPAAEHTALKVSNDAAAGFADYLLRMAGSNPTLIAAAKLAMKSDTFKQLTSNAPKGFAIEGIRVEAIPFGAEDPAVVAAINADISDELYVVLNLLEALSCTNVKADNVVKARGRSKTPIGKYSYKVLTVVASTGESHRVSSPSEEERRSPRQHLRRGHIRRLRDGRNIWINPMVINAGVGGAIQKEYKVKSA